MTSSRRGLQWLFRVYKIYFLAEDYVWKSGHPIPRKLYFYDEKGKLRMEIARNGKITVKKDIPGMAVRRSSRSSTCSFWAHQMVYVTD
jgi:hypothetical protein